MKDQAPVSGDEKVAYFVSLAGIEKLGRVLALMSHADALEVRKAAFRNVDPERVGLIRSAVLKNVGNAKKGPPKSKRWFA